MSNSTRTKLNKIKSEEAQRYLEECSIQKGGTEPPKPDYIDINDPEKFNAIDLHLLINKGTAYILMTILWLSICWEVSIHTDKFYEEAHLTLSEGSISCHNLDDIFDDKLRSLKMKSGGVNGYLDYGCKIFALVFTEGGTYNDFSHKEFNNMISSVGHGSN